MTTMPGRISSTRAPRRFLIIGTKHSGKTRFGSRLGRELAIEFFDLDELIRSELGEPVRDFYRREGEGAFRGLELRVLQSFLDDGRREDWVLAAGGGLAESAQAQGLLARLKRTGIEVILLRQAPETAFFRICRHGLPPFLETQTPYRSYLHLHFRREDTYRQIADRTIALRDRESETAAAQLAEALGENSNGR